MLFWLLLRDYDWKTRFAKGRRVFFLLTDADANAATASASDISPDASNEEMPLEPAGSDPAAPEMARRGTESWTLEAFLAKPGVDDLLNGATAAKKASILKDLGNIEK